MNDVDLQRSVREAAEPSRMTSPDLVGVRRRARTLRRRRAAGVALGLAIGVAAIAWPLHQLREIGHGSLPAAPADATIGFAPLDGWHTGAETDGGPPPESAAAIANVPMTGGALTAQGIDNTLLEHLPSTGIVIVAQQFLQTRNPVPIKSGYESSTLPLNLTTGSRATGPWEGLARSDLTQFRLSVLVAGRPIVVTAWLGTDHPDGALLADAQQALAQLTVPPADPPTAAIDQFGISLPVPDGWHALLYAGDPTLLVSTQPIDGLYWDDSRRALGPSDATIVLDESDAQVELQGWAPLVGPLSIGSGERCDGCEALDDGTPPAAGHALYERTFTTGGRAFSLFVEFGSDPSAAQIDQVNALLAGLAIQPLAEPTYTPAPGTTRVGPIYDGGDVPDVRPDTPDRTLAWSYAPHVAMQVPAGWTGRTYPVAGLEQPTSLLAAGSWDFTPGGYCGPINALRTMPSDGALVWVDGYVGTQPPPGQTFTDVPPNVDLGAAPTDPSPCFAGIDPLVFRWNLGGEPVVVHVAISPDATPATIADATNAVTSLGQRAR